MEVFKQDYFFKCQAGMVCVKQNIPNTKQGPKCLGSMMIQHQVDLPLDQIHEWVQ